MGQARDAGDVTEETLDETRSVDTAVSHYVPSRNWS